ncbi:heme-binding protein [Roseisolibacter sp. H3M3-2]|uniref:heme-binding protein n=1 Tax=Roseisolibacter sp. H3M3-2 TaxID=3031323 RepID=UPI0023DC0586|nr:heme-binding protein [Roseisolibacter sp. H3M3-2]MDF1505843.1 heme-binding protein [Roseisolibacter sp. H3M3-2]
MTRTPLLLSAALLACAALPARAQAPAGASASAVPTRAAPTLTLDGARRAVAGVEREAARLSRTFCVVVVARGGEVVAVARQDGVLPAICDVARAKARTAARYGRPSRAWAELLGRGNAGALATLPDMFAVEGGVPVLAGDVVVGAVGVSGASAAQDGLVAEAGAAAIR